MLKIGIIISTTRDGRFGDKPAQWLYDTVGTREDLQAEIIDLRDYPMPFYGETNEAVTRWQEKVAELDGYIFVTAEYNRAPTGVLKNALDHAYKEWNKKPAAFVGYGAVGAARAVEQLRLICAELQMAPLRNSAHIQAGDFMAVMKGERELTSFPYLQAGLEKLLGEVVWWGNALKAARERTLANVEAEAA